MWASERINSKHTLGAFGCGNTTLDKWFKTTALNADRAGTARTFVWSDAGSVVAYFSLCPHEIRRETLPAKLAKGSPTTVPAILLAKLALDETHQGQGLGGQLLVDAISRAVAAVEAAGGRFIVVDAIDRSAAAFYEHHGFAPVPGISARLVMKVSTAKLSIEASE